MPYGQCTNIDQPCPKVGEKIEIQEWEDMICPECGLDLIPLSEESKINTLPPILKLLPVIVVGLLVIGFGGRYLIQSVGNGESDNGEADSVREVSLVSVESLLSERVPAGFELEGQPTTSNARESGFNHVYDLLLAPVDAFRVPFVAIEVPENWPLSLRQMAPHLIVDSRVPAGNTFSITQSEALDPSIRVRAKWYANMVRNGNAWVVEGQDSLAVIEIDGIDRQLNWGILARAERDGFKEKEANVLSEYRNRWTLVEADIKNFLDESMRGVPQACNKDLKPLIRNVVRFSAECPRIADEAERNACFVDRDRLNSEIGSCETQNKLHKEGQTKARQAVASYTEKRMASFKEELVQGR